jgi:hypothetical protein
MMNSFVRTDLRHSHTSIEQLQNDVTSQPVAELYKLLLMLADGNVAIEEVRGQVRDLYSKFLAHSCFCSASLCDVREQLLAEQAQLKVQLAEAQRQVLERENQLSGLAAISADLECQRMALQQRLHEMLGSRSWKLTKPLRKLHEVLNR